MRLDLKDIIYVPGASVPFDFTLDLSELDWNGSRPAVNPVSVRGVVRNTAGALVLTAEAATQLELVCDRCGKRFFREKRVPYETLLATQLEDEDNDDIILLEGTQLAVDELMTEAFILAMDTKILCREDCKGLCPGCGVDLNEFPCSCKKEVDPRLAGLAGFFEK
ncbi:MAG: hypothetical protein H6Q60_967 [Oscillospiraceae bacterium]|nr:hypothetical protein [Oscillospiraceae bacterium]